MLLFRRQSKSTKVSYSLCGALHKFAAAISMLALAAIGRADNLYFQGFEQDASGFYDSNGNPGGVTRTAGTIAMPAYQGQYYGQAQNINDTYEGGYGNGVYTVFGYSATAPYPGAYSQSMAVYIDTSLTSSGQAFWIDASPGSSSPNDVANNGGLGYGDEHNFRLTYNGTTGGVTVTVDGETTPTATLLTSGWYDFQMTYQQGATPTSPVITDMNIYNSMGLVMGTDQVYGDSDASIEPDGLESQYLAGPGYEWLTVWQNGFSNNLLDIDNVSADTLQTNSPAPEPSTFGLLACAALAGGGLLLRRRG